MPHPHATLHDLCLVYGDFNRPAFLEAFPRWLLDSADVGELAALRRALRDRAKALSRGGATSLTGKRVQGEGSQPGDSREILVECEYARAMLQSDGGDKRIHGRHCHSFRAGRAKDGSGFAVSGKPAGFEHVPLGKVPFHPADVSSEALQNFSDHDSREGQWLGLRDHAAQLGARGAGRGAEKIDPHGTIRQYQTRFLRAAFRSPFQMPLP